MCDKLRKEVCAHMIVLVSVKKRLVTLIMMNGILFAAIQV